MVLLIYQQGVENLTKVAIHTLLLTLKGPIQYLKIKERRITDPATNMQYKGQNDSYRNANHIVCPKIYIGTQCLPSTSSSNTCGSVEVSENMTSDRLYLSIYTIQDHFQI
jgi:hypothetical protein